MSVEAEKKSIEREPKKHSVAIVGANGQIGTFLRQELTESSLVSTITDVRRNNFVEALSEPHDIIFLAIPTPENDDVFKTLAATITYPTIIVFPQNNVGVAERAGKYFPPNHHVRFVEAAIFTPVHKNEDGKSITYSKDQRQIALAPSDPDNMEELLAAHEIAELFDSVGFETAVYPDAENKKRMKRLFNSLGTTMVVTGMSPLDTFTDKDLFKMEQRGLRDRFTLYKASHTEITDFPWANPNQIRLIAERLPKFTPKLLRAFIAEKIAKRRNYEMPDGANKIAHGQSPTEKYWSHFRDEGLRLGIATPVDEAIHRIVEADAAGTINLKDFSLKNGTKKLHELTAPERKELLLKIYHQLLESRVSKKIQTWRRLSHEIANLRQLFPTDVIEDGPGLQRARDLSRQGYGGIFAMTHLSMSDPTRVLGNVHFPDPVFGDRTILTPWAVHHIKDAEPYGTLLARSSGVKFAPMVTEDTIKYMKEHGWTQEMLDTEKIKVGDGLDKYYAVAFPLLQAGGIVLVAPQTGREAYLGEPKPTMGQMVRFAMLRDIHNLYFTFVGISIPGEPNYDQDRVGGFNRHKRYALKIAETLTIDELIDLAKQQLTPEQLQGSIYVVAKNVAAKVDAIMYQKLAAVSPPEYLKKKIS